jgi:hypothetical protein
VVLRNDLPHLKKIFCCWKVSKKAWCFTLRALALGQSFGRVQLMFVTNKWPIGNMWMGHLFVTNCAYWQSANCSSIAHKEQCSCLGILFAIDVSIFIFSVS